MKINKGDEFRYKHNRTENPFKNFIFRENEKVKAVDEGMTNSSKGKYVIVSNGEKEMVVWLENLETVNKFEVGEEVIYEGKKVNIFGINKTGDFAAIEWERERLTNAIKTTHIRNLSKIKDKNNLEKGDKFITDIGDEVKVIAGEYCEMDDEMKYLGKRIHDGYVIYWRQHEIEEVIQ